MVVNSTCTISDSANCGGNGPCLASQTCQFGKCTCSLPLLNFFQWQPAIDVDLDGINRVDPYGQAVQGCVLDVNTQSLATGFIQKVTSYLDNWVLCISNYNNINHAKITRFTAAEFGNATVRQKYCPSGPGLCSADYCDALYANFTGSARSNFCSSYTSLMSLYKGCAAGYHLNNQNPDISCATMLASDLESQLGFVNLDLFSFLGCDVPRPDMVYVIRGNLQPEVNMYRRNVSSKFLASGRKLFFLNLATISISVLFGAFTVLC